MKKRGKVYLMGMDQMVLPLTRYFAQEGSLPTIAKLLERSACNTALASFPSYTANNWPVIATGANTGTHGAFSWFIRMPDGQDVSSLTSLGINAEFIWEAAERQGIKSAVLHYPGTLPSRLKQGYIIDGNAGPAFGACPFELATAEAYTTDRSVESPSLKEIVLKPAAGWKGLPAGGPRPLETSIPVTAKNATDSQEWQVIVLGGPGGYDRVVVCKEKDLASAICDCRPGQWSGWAFVPFGGRTGTVRFKVTALSPDGRALKLYRSQMMPTTGFSDPDEIGAELIQAIGPYQEYVSMISDHGCSPINRKVYMETFLIDKGFLVLRDPTLPKTTFVSGWYDKIDWDKSRVWLHEGVFLDPFNIYINAEKGSAKYDQIQRDLIRELRTWVDPDTQQTVVAMALSKRDVQLIGLWGNQVGDVIVVLEGGYQMGRKDSPVTLEDNSGTVVSGHGRMIPTYETTYGTEKAIFTIAGPGIKRGYERPVDTLGPIKLLDVTPTLCHLLGIAPPAQSQGAIAHDLFEGHEMVRQRPDPTPEYAPIKHYKGWMQKHLYDYGILKEESVPC